MDRPRDPAKWGEIADVVAALSIPVIANGDVFDYADFERIKVATGREMIFYQFCRSHFPFSFSFAFILGIGIISSYGTT